MKKLSILSLPVIATAALLSSCATPAEVTHTEPTVAQQSVVTQEKLAKRTESSHKRSPKKQALPKHVPTNPDEPC